MATEPVKIAPEVYWVGANDNETELFEGLWHIPEGISYNSYLIKDSKTGVLIDSVLSRFGEEHLEKIRKVVEPVKIEYVVINHMEPDHTGALLKVLEVWPKARVVATPMTRSMLRSYYHIEPEIVDVKGEGTKICLNGRTLQFLPTPFLHWPETMCTYLVEEKILFSCDPFGSFKCLPEGKVMEDDITDIEPYMYRSSKKYFAGVFVRHREYVLKALKKFSDMQIETRILAPSHGPVYTTHARQMLDLWASWSRPDYKRKTVIAAGSMYGITSNFLDAVVEGVREAGSEAVIFDLVKQVPIDVLEAMLDSPALIIGTPTYESDIFPPVMNLLNLLQIKKLTNRFVGVFGNFGWSGGGVKKLVDTLQTSGFKLVESPVETKGDPLPEDLDKARKMAKATVEAAFESLQF